MKSPTRYTIFANVSKIVYWKVCRSNTIYAGEINGNADITGITGQSAADRIRSNISNIKR